MARAATPKAHEAVEQPESEIVAIDLPEGVSGDLEVAKEKGLVWLYPPKGAPVLGFWRNTRKFVAMRWEPTAFWALWEGLGKLPFEPVGWKPQ